MSARRPFCARSIAAVLAAVLAVLVQSHLVQLWHVYALSTMLGGTALLLLARTGLRTWEVQTAPVKPLAPAKVEVPVSA